MNKILETKNLVGGYGQIEIIHGIDFHIEPQEIVSVIGPNGSGKSTLIKVMYGLATHFSGDVFYQPSQDEEPENIAGRSGNELVKRGIAYVPQRNNVFPNLSIRENLEMGGYTLNNPHDAISKVYETYPFLREREKEKARVLSGGQRQMLALGRALMIDPTLIILDEPSAALQPSLVMDIMNQIKRLREINNLSVLMVEQNTKSALRISDRGYILAAGNIVHEDQAETLLHETDLAKYYLGGYGEEKEEKKPSKESKDLCPNCNSPVDYKGEFCEHCGEELDN